MKHINVKIDDKEAYVAALGDFHEGDLSHKGAGEKALQKDLNWLGANDNARAFLNGDLLNCASRISKTNPFTSDSNEYEKVSELLKPYAKQFIGISNGNHENRMLDMFGVSPLQWLAKELNIPYCGYSAVVSLQVGKRNDNTRYNQLYRMYFHHGAGGGSTIGGKINSILKLRNIIEGMDVYFSNHTHQQIIHPQKIYTPSNSIGFKERVVYFINSGGYLGWNDSYAEKNTMAPTKMGTPIVKFFGHDSDNKNHKIEVTLL